MYLCRQFYITKPMIKRRESGKLFFHSTILKQSLPKILHLWILKVPFFLTRYFCTLSFKCQFCLPLSRQKLLFFLLSTKKTKCPRLFFFVYITGKVWPKIWEFGHVFPPLNLGLMFPIWSTENLWLDHSMFAYCCSHLWPSSRRLFQICRRAFSVFTY